MLFQLSVGSILVTVFWCNFQNSVFLKRFPKLQRISKVTKTGFIVIMKRINSIVENLKEGNSIVFCKNYSKTLPVFESLCFLTFSLYFGIDFILYRSVGCVFNTTPHWTQLLSSENISTCVRKKLEVQSCLLSMLHGCLNSMF